MTYYDELGISPTATTEEIKRAYRQISKLYHPDLQTDENVRQVAEIQQRRLNSIVATLTNPEERANYDQSLRSGTSNDSLQPRFAPGGLDAFVPPPAPSGFSSGRRQRFVWGGLFALPVLGSALFWWFTERNIVGVPVNTANPSATEARQSEPPAPAPEPAKPVETATNSVPLPVPFPLPAPPGASAPAEKSADSKKTTPEKSEKKSAEADKNDKKKPAAAEPKASDKQSQQQQAREQNSKLAAAADTTNKGAEAKNNATPPANKPGSAAPAPAVQTVAHAAAPSTPPPPTSAPAAAPTIAPPPAVAAALPNNAPHLGASLPSAAPAATPTAEAAATTANPANGKPPATGVVAGLNGMWIYVPMTKDKANNHGIYPPEYIELALQQNRGRLQGIYRSRYRISDRPVTPEVNFQFQGSEAGSQQYGWKLSDGTRGQVRLQQLSATTIQVDWYVTQFGRSPGLASGSAVLTRRP